MDEELRSGGGDGGGGQVAVAFLTVLAEVQIEIKIQTGGRREGLWCLLLLGGVPAPVPVSQVLPVSQSPGPQFGS